MQVHTRLANTPQLSVSQTVRSGEVARTEVPYSYGIPERQARSSVKLARSRNVICIHPYPYLSVHRQRFTTHRNHCNRRARAPRPARRKTRQARRRERIAHAIRTLTRLIHNQSQVSLRGATVANWNRVDAGQNPRVLGHATNEHLWSAIHIGHARE